jgi:hypothetical protein
VGSRILGAFTVATLAVLAWLAWRPSPEDIRTADARVIAASMAVGFTKPQAAFLRSGPMSSTTLCATVEFSESQCEFFRWGSVEGERHSDEEFYATCHAAPLTYRQCELLRNGSGKQGAYALFCVFQQASIQRADNSAPKLLGTVIVYPLVNGEMWSKQYRLEAA